jgi:hypothetical protein
MKLIRNPFGGVDEQAMQDKKLQRPQVPPPLSRIEFQAACGKYLVDPGLALENKEVLAAVKAGNLTALHSALLNEF